MTCQSKCKTCTCSTPPPPTFIHLRDAARRVGLTTGALSRRLNRFEQHANGFAIRRAHGLIHLQDFERWVDTLAKPSRATSAAAYVRKTVRKMEGR